MISAHPEIFYVLYACQAKSKEEAEALARREAARKRRAALRDRLFYESFR